MTVFSTSLSIPYSPLSSATCSISKQISHNRPKNAYIWTMSHLLRIWKGKCLKLSPPPPPPLPPPPPPPPPSSELNIPVFRRKVLPPSSGHTVSNGWWSDVELDWLLFYKHALKLHFYSEISIIGLENGTTDVHEINMTLRLYKNISGYYEWTEDDKLFDPTRMLHKVLTAWAVECSA